MIASPTSTIAFIGGGNMARSLIGGLIRTGTSPDNIMVSEPNADTLTALVRDFGIRTSETSVALNGYATLVLAVKPQVMPAVCEQLNTTVQTNQPLIISIAAGVRTEQIEHWLGGHLSIVRCMPNTPALIGAGASGLYANEHVSATQRTLTETLFNAVGICTWIEREEWMDIVTALSGSGPAYFFLLIEALEEAAIRLGLPRDVARVLASQTCLGAGRMAREEEASPAILRERVTSPGGTTQAALESLHKNDFREIIAHAVQAATKRSYELSQQNY